MQKRTILDIINILFFLKSLIFLKVRFVVLNFPTEVMHTFQKFSILRRVYIPDDRPRFLVAYNHGIVQLMRHENDSSG